MQIHNTVWTLSSGAQPMAWAFSFCFTCLAAGSLPAVNRWPGVLLLVVPAYGAFQTSQNLSPNAKLNATFSRFVIILFSHMVALCFSPGSRISMVEDKTKYTDKSWIKGWKRAYNSRGIGLVWENPYLWPEQKSTAVFAEPLKEGTFKDKPIEAPSSRHNLATRSKWSAVFIRLGYALFNYIVMSLYYEFGVSTTVGSFTYEDLSPEKEGILRRMFQQCFDASVSSISSREVGIRAIMVVNKFLPDILYLSIFHDLLAVLLIGTGIDESWEWPPLFGPITQAYSMRRFWAGFWHRLVYKSFSFHAATTTKMLRIQQGTTLSRILNNWLVFIFSAVMHAVVLSVHGSTACAWGRGTLVFWGIQPLSFLFEGLVQSYWIRTKKKSFFWVNQSIMSNFERTVGYCWVVAWLLWITPKSVFPLLHCKA